MEGFFFALMLQELILYFGVCHIVLEIVSLVLDPSATDWEFNSIYVKRPRHEEPTARVKKSNKNVQP